MPQPTYTALATVTLTSTASSVTFSNIPATYRDLILTVNGAVSSGQNLLFYFNNDTTAANYFRVTMDGDGSTTASGSANNAQSTTMYSTPTVLTFQVMDYSATDKHKTSLNRIGAAGSLAGAVAARWANTAAVTSVRLQTQSGTFNSGNTFNLFGVIA
jgi:hypothetical protein